MTIAVGTHDGAFHADEVFAIATLRLAVGDLVVRRTRGEDALAGCDLVVDVGRVHDPEAGRFDHHQRGGAGARDTTGVGYAAFGLVWKHLGASVCDDDVTVAFRVDERLVQPVDADDLGGAQPNGSGGSDSYSISRAITALNPPWDLEADESAFDGAVELAERILRAEIRAAQAERRAKAHVLRAIRTAADPRIVELERWMPWQPTILAEAPEALFVLHRGPSGDWRAQAVPQIEGSLINRRPFPESWAGRAGSELAAMTGVHDAIFCHAGRFLVVAASRAGARRLVQLAAAT